MNPASGVARPAGSLAHARDDISARLVDVRVILQGSLAHFPAAEVLPLLASHAHSGTLVVEWQDKRIRVFLRDGKIDWTEAGSGLGAEEAILDLFSWGGGEFSLHDEVILPDGARALDLDPAVLIEEGKRRSGYRPQQIFAVVNPPDDREQISLKPDEFNVLFRIGSGKSLEQVAAEVGRPFGDVVSIIRTLHTNGLIQEMEAEGPPIEVSDKTFHLSTIRTKPEPEVTTPQRTATRTKKPRTKTLAGSLTAQGASGGASGYVHPLLDAEYLIGREASNTIVLNDASVSARHARIVRSPDGFIIEDLKSRNGTFVNGERVTEARPLTDNDVVRFGRVILTFNVATESAPSEVTNPGVQQ